ncbi:hypothetical protein PPYR_01146 [Photinus pyralis]|uniref:SUN domain-containing protein n=1 Tax=Photinus pyralis TaxID=7054 RepID=A0A5N4B3N1_PHOPY|nr:hypothetical protein PPYR_01146 [Photinus pyralis]
MRNRLNLRNHDGITKQSTSTTSLTQDVFAMGNLDISDFIPTPKENLRELCAWDFNIKNVLKHFLTVRNVLGIAVVFISVLCRYLPSKEALCVVVVDELLANCQSKLQDEIAAIRNQMNDISTNPLFLNLIDEKIQAAVHLYDTDKIGLIDYAMESSGARIISMPGTQAFNHAFNLADMFSTVPTDASKILQPGTLPGQCFSFRGSTGRIRISLACPVYVTAFTLEHVHKSLAQNRTSAPKEFQVYGLDGEEATDGFSFGVFKYNLEGNALQMFKVQNQSSVLYKHLELHVLSNYGNPTYTCIYRFRVHGKE